MTLLATIALALVVAQTPPQERPSASTAPPPKVEPLAEGQVQVLQALVIGVEGRAEWRKSGAGDFKAAALNDLLDPGCEIRTGLRSSLTLRVGKNATVLVDRSSHVELPTIVQNGAVLVTRAALLRGKCDVKVEAVGVTSDFKVATPSATLAVRGTGLEVEWGALDGARVRGVATNRVHAIEVAYLDRFETVFLSGDDETTEEIPEPVRLALYRTFFLPPRHDLQLDDVGQDPTRLPPQFDVDFKQRQQVDHGGSSFGRNVQTGQGTPGIPPIHG
jgi:hypothetical protein